jgi:hypothetical protein
VANAEHYYLGRVLHEHNDKEHTFPADEWLPLMVYRCGLICNYEMSPPCTEFDFVYDKRTCYFSTSGGDESELKVDVDAVAFFMKY